MLFKLLAVAQLLIWLSFRRSRVSLHLYLREFESEVRHKVVRKIYLSCAKEEEKVIAAAAKAS